MTGILETAVVPGVAPWVVVHLHGTGGDERQLEQLAGELAPGATLVGVRGNVLEGGHVRRFFARHGDGILDLADLARSADAIAATVEQVVAEQGLAGQPVLGIGFSNGANALAAVHARHPRLLAGSVLLRQMWDGSFGEHADVATTGRDAAGRASILALGGRADPYLDEAASRALAATLAPLGIDLEERVLPAGHGPTPADVALATAWFADQAPAVSPSAPSR